MLAFTLLLTAASLQAPAQGYERTELHIPVRDGAKLYAVALIPQDQSRTYPIIFIRTPFSAANELRTNTVPTAYGELAADGYIFVVQDIRGRFGSEGDFVSLRPLTKGKGSTAVDESTDAWDSVDWLVKHLPRNNGKVGVLGMSYRGWLAGMAAIRPHPAVKAVSPQAPMTDVWMGDDFFHQGAFRQTQGVLYSAFIESNPRGFGEFEGTGEDEYRFYLGFPTLDSLARATKVAAIPFWQSLVAHPTWDTWWQERALQHQLRTPPVPMLIVGGFWDAEDLLGPQLLYRTLERADRQQWNRVVFGPWTHGSWMNGVGDSAGSVALGAATAKYFREQIQRPWFAHYLHGQGDGAFPEAWVFETGGARWRTFDRWPPAQVRSRKLYLRANGALSFAAPTKEGAASYDGFTSDPADPVPYTRRPITEAGWRTWLLDDQRFLAGRKDVLTWQTEPLTDDLVIAGDVIAKLVASTTGTDADWVVKLIDVYPDSATVPGRQLMVNAAIQRGRYHQGFSRSTPLVAGRPTPFTIDLHQQLYRFRKGHRLMVQVQSTWFPLYDRNPQTFVPTIFAAQASTYQKQEHRIWRTASAPSYLELPLLP